MPLILYECASPRFRHIPPNWIPMIRVTFKFISALKQWLVCTNFFAIIHLHVRTHSSKNYLPTFLHGFILTFLITLPMSTLRMKSQPIQSTLQLLHFILTTQLTSLKYFYIVLIFYATPRFLPQGRQHATYKKGRRPRTTDDPQEGPEALDYQKSPLVGECPQLIPPFLGSPGRKQPEPLPTVETR